MSLPSYFGIEGESFPVVTRVMPQGASQNFPHCNNLGRWRQDCHWAASPFWWQLGRKSLALAFEAVFTMGRSEVRCSCWRDLGSWHLIFYLLDSRMSTPCVVPILYRSPDWLALPALRAFLVSLTY